MAKTPSRTYATFTDPAPPTARGFVSVSPVDWGALGVWVGTSPPANPVTYAQWLATRQGYWAFLDISGV